jgi:hypothetical protein
LSKVRAPFSLHEIDARQKTRETRAGISSFRCVWKDFFSEISKKDQGLIPISKMITKSAHNYHLIYNNIFKKIKLQHVSDLTSPS